MATEMFDKIKKMKAEYERAIKEFGQGALKEVFVAFFEANPKAKAITWTQYTPYFNDGEACVFGVNEMCVQIEGEDHDEDEDGFASYALKRKPEFKAMGKALEEILIPDDIMLSVFGDHVKVAATREGFQVDSYDHD